MNRCINHIFGYCHNKPQLTTREVPQTYCDIVGRKHTSTITITTCHLNRNTCPHYLTSAQLQTLISLTYTSPVNPTNE